MDSNFSPKVKEIISYSREEALRLGNDFIGTEHLLLGLIRDGDSTAINVLQSLHVDLVDLRKSIEMVIRDKGSNKTINANSLPLTSQAVKVIRITVLEAMSLKKQLVESEHLMLSILKNKENPVVQILNEHDVNYEDYKNELNLALGQSSPDTPKADFPYGTNPEGSEDESGQFQRPRQGSGSTTKSKTPVLDNYGRDITKMAMQGNLDPIVGREEEIERVSQILSRRNPSKTFQR